MALPVDLSEIPWSFVMAFLSLAIIYYIFRRRADVFAEFGFSGKEVALLALGSVAGWAVHVPIVIFGGTYLAVNLGGTIVPILLIAWWIRQRKLRIIPAIVGVALVSFTAWTIVEFDPNAGIIARYPTFFLPVLVALVYALIVSIKRPLTGVPIAYASGALGALIGADVMHVADIRQHFLTAPDRTVISIGGAGVFDMVFLAGTFAMALYVTIIAIFHRRRTHVAEQTYPATPLTLRDSRRVHDTFRRLEAPNALDRAIQGIALSNIALRDGDYAKSIRMSWLAVDSVMRAAPTQIPDAARDDARRLQEQYVATRSSTPSLSDAGNANLAAKHLVAALAPHAKLRHNLEGVA